MTQGWSTLYDLKVLNSNLVVAGVVTDDADVSAQTVSILNPTLTSETSA